MYSPAPTDLTRFRQLLNVANYRNGAHLVFCPKCPFQYEPETLGRSDCPDCGTHLRFVVVDQGPDQELRDLTK